MKTIVQLSGLFLLLNYYSVTLQACTSFAVYSGEVWYGMNFDYPPSDIRFSIYETGNRKVFMAQFGSEGGYIAGMNDSGLFTNYQLLYYNQGEPAFPTLNTLSIGNLTTYATNQLSTVNEVTEYIGTTIIIPSFGLNLQTLFAGLSDAIIMEPFGTCNGIVPVSGNFIVMTNFPVYDFLGMDYHEVYGVGSERYKTAFNYISDHIATFGYDDALETLSRTVQYSGDYPTKVSLLFDPVNMNVYFCVERDFSKVWKVSVTNETIETYSGYDSYGIVNLDNTGIWSYDLPSIDGAMNTEESKNSDHFIAEIYPNPSNGNLSIRLNSALRQSGVAEIFNADGKSVVSHVFTDTSKMIFNLNGYPGGLYFIKLSVGGEIFSCKFFLN